VKLDESGKDDLIAYERFVQSVISEREKPKKPAWQTVIESSGFVALVTVSLGGWISTIIVDSLQRNAKHLEGRQTALVRALDLVGKTMAKTTSRRDVDRVKVVLGNRTLQPPETQERVKRAFNSAWEDWDAEKRAAGWLLAYYFPLDFEKSWVPLVKKVDGMLVTVGDHLPTEDPNDNIDKEIQDAQSEIDTFFQALRFPTAGENLLQRWLVPLFGVETVLLALSLVAIISLRRQLAQRIETRKAKE